MPRYVEEEFDADLGRATTGNPGSPDSCKVQGWTALGIWADEHGAASEGSHETYRRLTYEVAERAGLQAWTIPGSAAFHCFGVWKRSLFGDHHAYGEEGVRFCTRYNFLMRRSPDALPKGPAFAASNRRMARH